MKYNLKFIGTFVFIAVMVLPATSFAVAPESTTKNTEVQFCATLDKRAVEVTAKVDDKQEKANIRQNDRANKKSADRAQRDVNIQIRRDGWDAHRAERIEKLNIKAKTDVQKAAVVQFNTAMTTAITARKAAVDAAIVTFRTGVDSVTGTRNTTVDTAIATLKAARLAALEKAKTDCAAGIDAKIAKTTFETSMKAALDAFKTTQAGVIKRNEVTVLSQARRAAIDKALADFKAAADAAQATLKLAFPKV